jgi:hypothetical protein
MCKHVFLKAIVVLFFAIPILCVSATKVETLQIDPLTERMLIFNLSEGDKFSGSLSISGGANNDIDFWITDPNGNTIVNLGRISQGTTFEFTAQKSGAYTFHFGNSFSLFSSKTVSLSYDIQFALPINPLLLITIGLIIVGLVLIILVVLVLLYRRKTQQKMKEKG